MNNYRKKISISKKLKFFKSQMNIIILGAGAIGSFYGAKLSKLNDVTLIARKAHADNINKNGLKITGLENKTYKLKAETEIKRIESDTLILLTTKVYDSKKAIDDIKNLVKEDTIILCLQNGLYSENIVKNIVGKKCLVLRAVTNFGAAFLKPGVIQYNNYSYTAIEKNQKAKIFARHASERVREITRSQLIAKIFAKCGLNGYVSENVKADMWKKLIMNCVLNPITAILKIENMGIVDEKLNSLKKLIVNECLKVAEKDSVKFNIDFVKEINETFKNSRNISSMYQDLTKGNQTEIDYLNGAVVKLGRKYGIKCPVNQSLVNIIKEMEKNSL